MNNEGKSIPLSLILSPRGEGRGEGEIEPSGTIRYDC